VPVISLNGPHAIGKTTAVKRWIDRYPGLVAVIADNQWEVRGGVYTRVREWKGDIGDKGRLVRASQLEPVVTLVDSVRTTVVNFLGPKDFAIFVTCSGPTMGRVLRERCVRNNKKFAEAYWDDRKLSYEGETRYRNAAAKYLQPHQYRFFTVEDQEQDWPAVDDYFHTLYRRLHNELVARRQGAGKGVTA
jgi:hypothetical protein